MSQPAPTIGVVIVSGGTYGIGRAISVLLAERGWSVVAFGLDAPQVSSEAQNGVAALKQYAQEKNLPITAVEADVSSEDDVARVVELALTVKPIIYGLVNNAAIGPLGTVLDTPPALWDQIMAVNLRGPYLTGRAVIPHMVRSGGGCIVNIGSGAGWGKPNMAAYAATKGGLFALTTAMALDHFEDRIRVNAVVPGGGGIEAGMSLGRVGGDLNKLRSQAVGTVAGRFMEGEDLARSVAFLLSDDAQTISGTVIDVGCFSRQGSSMPLKKSI